MDFLPQGGTEPFPPGQAGLWSRQTHCPLGEQAGGLLGGQSHCPMGEQAGWLLGEQSHCPMGEQAGGLSGEQSHCPMGEQAGGLLGKQSHCPISKQAGELLGEQSHLTAWSLAHGPTAWFCTLHMNRPRLHSPGHPHHWVTCSTNWRFPLSLYSP